jgi:hypothetical protein
MTINTKKKEGVQWSSAIVVVLALSVAVASGGLDLVVRNGGLKLRAWALLFSGEREEALQAWRWAYPLETRVEYPMRPIGEVNAEGESEGVSEWWMEWRRGRRRVVGEWESEWASGRGKEGEM